MCAKMIELPKHTSFKDLTGKRYGRLVAKKYSGKLRGRSSWLWVCDCGQEKIITGNDVCNGNTRSCGCLLAEHRASNRKTHGMSKHPVYAIWAGMIDRCENPKNKSFKHYGGRGIKICHRWRTDFLNFYNDMGPRPTPGHTIDRTNNNGNYDPSNCKWVTMKKQASNKRLGKNNKIGIAGVYFVAETQHWRICGFGIDGKRTRHLGVRDNLLDACAVRKDYENKKWRHLSN